MAKKTDRPKSVRDLIVLADPQSPFTLWQTWALACEYVKRVVDRAKRKGYPKPLIVLNGDIGDHYTISRFRKIGRGPDSLLDEIAVTNDYLLDPLDAVAGNSEKWLIDGNHEARLDGSLAMAAGQPGPAGEIAKYIQQKGLISLDKEYKLKERGYKRFKAEDGKTGWAWIIEDVLMVLHGVYTNKYAAAKHLEAIGASLIMGHVHREQTARDTKALTKESHIALASGCLCKDPDWNCLDRYDRGFIAGWFDRERKVFDIQHKRISGKENTELYCEFGRLNAIHVGGDNWKVKKI